MRNILLNWKNWIKKSFFIFFILIIDPAIFSYYFLCSIKFIIQFSWYWKKYKLIPKFLFTNIEQNFNISANTSVRSISRIIPFNTQSHTLSKSTPPQSRQLNGHQWESEGFPGAFAVWKTTPFSPRGQQQTIRSNSTTECRHTKSSDIKFPMPCEEDPLTIGTNFYGLRNRFRCLLKNI